MTVNYERVSIKVAIHTSGNFTTAVLTTDDGTLLVGNSKRNPSDPKDVRLGASLAIARLYREIADYIETSHYVVPLEDDE